MVRSKLLVVRGASGVGKSTCRLRVRRMHVGVLALDRDDLQRDLPGNDWKVWAYHRRALDAALDRIRIHLGTDRHPAVLFDNLEGPTLAYLLDRATFPTALCLFATDKAVLRRRLEDRTWEGPRIENALRRQDQILADRRSGEYLIDTGRLGPREVAECVASLIRGCYRKADAAVAEIEGIARP